MINFGLDILEVEHDNIRSALGWCRSAEGAAQLGLVLAASLEYFWDIRGYFQEGRKQLSASLDSPGAQKRTEARAKALHAEAHLAYLQGDYPLVEERLEESLSIYRELGPSGMHGAATVLITLGDTTSGAKDDLLTGGRYDPSDDSWRVFEPDASWAGVYSNAPAIWTGTDAIFFQSLTETTPHHRYCPPHKALYLYLK